MPYLETHPNIATGRSWKHADVRISRVFERSDGVVLLAILGASVVPQFWPQLKM